MTLHINYQVIDRVIIALIVTIHIVSIAVSPLLSALIIPLYALFYNRLIIATARVINFSSIAPRFVLLDGKLYFTKVKMYMYIYKIEPLVSCERIEAPRLWSLLQDMIKRLVSVNVSVGFARLADGTKYFIILSKEDHAKAERTAIQTLSELFLVRRLSKRELKLLFSARDLSWHEILFLLLPLLSFALYFPMTIAVLVVAVVVALKVREDFVFADRFIISTSKLRSITFNRMMYTKAEHQLVKTTMLTISRSSMEYVFIFSGNPELKETLERDLHRAQEGLVVREKGKAYMRLLEVKNAVDRISEGETTLSLSMIICSTSTPILFAYGSGTVSDLLVSGSPALSGDIIALVPLYSGSLTLEGSQTSEIVLGVDKHEKEVRVDLGALPSCHMLILGPSGMGKTWTARTLVKKLLEKGVNIVIVDPHGEYSKYFPELRHVVVPKSLPNIFEVHELSKSERIHKLIRAIEPYVNQECLSEVYSALTRVYSLNLQDNPHLALKEISRFLETGSTCKILIERIREIYSQCNIVDIEYLSHSCIIDLSPLLTSPDLVQLFSVLIVDLLYTYLVSRRDKSRQLSLILVDEAYFLLASPLTELIVRGFRKFNVGIVLITQTLSSVSSDVLQNIGLFLVLGGSDAYVSSLLSYLDLSKEDVEWLLGAVPPSISRRVRALLVTGPIKRHVLIDLV